MDGTGATQAERTLDEVSRLRNRTQVRAHSGAWFPAALIATLILLSIALYEHPFGQPNEIVAAYPFWAGLADAQRSPVASYLFWFAGTPAMFAIIALWYRWRARRVGMRVAWPVVAGTGLGVLVLLAVLAAVPPPEPSSDAFGIPPAFSWPGLLTPLLPVAAAVIVLGWAERSKALAAAGVWIALLAAWLCGSFPLGRLPGWLTWLLDGGEGPALGGNLSLRPGHYLIVMALPLLMFAAVRAWRARRLRA
jgi:hypothetical protein